MAVGNPFGLPGGGNSVTVGVVSFKGRDLELGVRNTSVEMIQTDAAINPGNSGGPLINTRGEVVGINTMIVTGGAQASAGVGFSVPINVAKEILPQLREKGKVTRGWMGVTIGPMTEDLAATYGLSEAQGRARQLGRRRARPPTRPGCSPRTRSSPPTAARSRTTATCRGYIASLAPGQHGEARAACAARRRRRVSVTLGTFPDQAPETTRAPSAGRASLGMTLRDLTPGRGRAHRPAPRHARRRGGGGRGRRGRRGRRASSAAT